VGAFLECYQRLVAEGEPVVSIHVSAKLSGTFNSALQARNLLNGSVPVEVVDSEEASIALGLVAMAAAEVAATGAGLEVVVEATRNAVARARLFFVLDTLEYLQKGGRIGRAQAFLGSVLSVKPILEVREGEVMPLERTRNRRKAVDRVCSLVEGQAPLARLAVVHATSPQEAEALAQRLSPLIAGGEVLVSQVGPVVGTYTGPGCLGVGLIRQG
jgi:DegV family protein with EDD domain